MLGSGRDGGTEHLTKSPARTGNLPNETAEQTYNIALPGALARRSLLLLPALQACSAIRKKSKLLVGFSQMENNNPWRIAETKSMQAEAERRSAKYEIVITDAQGQTAKQVSDVEDLIARRVSAIFLAPREFEGLAPALDSARELKIPVFLIDREAAGTPGEDYVCFIGSDFVQQARRVADWLIAHTGGKASIVELTGTPG